MSLLHPAEISAELSQYSFFCDFPTDALLVFATMASARTYEAQELLLEQGKSNDCLFFLRSGRVKIEVDGENVFELFEPGEVIGEMSLINRRPVTANVRAITTVDVFQVSESHILSLPSQDRLKFQHLLYRVYSSVLADRLAKTNDKAKKFEIAHRNLQLVLSDLAKVNSNLEAEIARRSSELVQKIINLTESHLNPARETISRWSEGSFAQVANQEVHQILQSITEVIDFLKPVAELSQKGISNQSRRVLLCDGNKKQQTIARLALGGTGVNLTLASHLEELKAALQAHSFDLVICDAELRDSVEFLTKDEARYLVKTPVALLVGIDMQFYLQTLRDFPKNSFFISRDINHRTWTIKNISTTVSKILNKDYFGMEKYLSWGARVIENQIWEAAKRQESIETMKEYFKSFGIRTSILDKVHTVTEELLMNAIYDAPVDSNGKSLYNHISRVEKIVLKAEHAARLRYGTDGVFLAVSVTDPFGTLSKEIITKYLESCYTGAAGSLNSEKGGAGRGLHLIVENGDLTVFNVKNRQTSEVICLFNLDKSQDESHSSTFHLFFVE